MIGPDIFSLSNAEFPDSGFLFHVYFLSHLNYSTNKRKRNQTEDDFLKLNLKNKKKRDSPTI